MDFSETPTIGTTFQPDSKINKIRREQLYNTIVYGSSHAQLKPPLHPDQSPPTRSQIQSFILSIILCPDFKYSSSLAQLTLQSLAPTPREREVLLKPAFELLHDKYKFISLRSGSVKPEGPRKYRATTRFFEQFGPKNCLVTAEMLRDAARYKAEVLDEAFCRGETVLLDKDTKVDGGEMLALMQLLGAGKVEIRSGDDIPKSRYGVAWERVGYQSRLLNMEDFAFGVVIAKTDGYLSDDAMEKRDIVDIPVGMPGRFDRTPMWADLSGKPLQETWEMVLGAVLGIVSLRPGIGEGEVCKMLGFAVGAWEVELMLNWAVEMGVVKKTKSARGWETREGWWLCLGVGSTENGDVDEAEDDQEDTSNDVTIDGEQDEDEEGDDDDDEIIHPRRRRPGRHRASRS